MANGQGGARAGAGRKRNCLADALADGTAPQKLLVLDIPGGDVIEQKEAEQYLKDEQKDGAIEAERYYKEIWAWLEERECQKYFDPHFLQRFCMLLARYVQLERLVSKYGFLTKGADGGLQINPMETALQARLKMLNQMQSTIDSTVRANCTIRYSDTKAAHDPIRALLEARGA